MPPFKPTNQGLNLEPNLMAAAWAPGLFKRHYSDRAIVSGMAAMPDFH
jgi:hypothetical protein